MQPALTPTDVLGQVGPFVFTWEISLSGLLTMITLLVMAYKVARHMTIANERVEELWRAIMGKGPEDRNSFFARFHVLENRVRELWERRTNPRASDGRFYPFNTNDEEDGA